MNYEEEKKLQHGRCYSCIKFKDIDNNFQRTDECYIDDETPQHKCSNWEFWKKRKLVQ